jgi:hypothetical protein
MEVQVKKTIKIISKKYHIPYEDLKSVAKKYLSGAKEYDSGLLNTIEELLDLVEINEIDEIDSFSIPTLQLFARVREIEYSSDRELKKNVKEYFEALFEESEESDSEDSEDSEESESDNEETEEDSDSGSDNKGNIVKFKEEPELHSSESKVPEDSEAPEEESEVVINKKNKVILLKTPKKK